MNKKTGIVFGIVALLLVIFCCAVCVITVLLFANSNGSKQAMSCTYNGQVYAEGATFPSIDKCNSCGCNNGQVV
jgi:flagellar basal body-associated protein FliL